jgi:hypothetical protein
MSPTPTPLDEEDANEAVPMEHRDEQTPKDVTVPSLDTKECPEEGIHSSDQDEYSDLSLWDRCTWNIHLRNVRIGRALIDPPPWRGGGAIVRILWLGLLRSCDG